MGIINAGTAVGSVLPPPLIGVILLTVGWRMVFFGAGAAGFAWVAWCLIAYRGNNAGSIATLDARLVAKQLSFLDVLRMRKDQVLAILRGTLTCSGCCRGSLSWLRWRGGAAWICWMLP
jgi:ACS family hexuronate transporter-like MFS transporter